MFDQLEPLLARDDIADTIDYDKVVDLLLQNGITPDTAPQEVM